MSNSVAPLVGAWIEINAGGYREYRLLVAPLVGAWIEISATGDYGASSASLLSWERGLKSGTTAGSE